MTTTSLKSEVRRLVSEAELIKAIELLEKSIDEEEVDLVNRITLIKARFHKSKKDLQVRLISDEAFSISYNKLCSNILELTSSISAESADKDEPKVVTGFERDPLLRTRLISFSAKRIYEDRYLGAGIVRQKGDFTSFSIPNENLSDKIWTLRTGEEPRSKEYHKLQREERYWLQKHALAKKCKLIIYPYLYLSHRGVNATISRLRTLRKFILANQGNVKAVISNGAKDMSILTIGNWFMVDSIPTKGQGYRNTFYSWNRNIVEHYNIKFDREFQQLLEEQGIEEDDDLARDKCIDEIDKAIDILRRRNFGKAKLTELISQGFDIINLAQDSFRYIQYDSTVIYLNPFDYEILLDKLKEFCFVKEEDQKLVLFRDLKSLLSSVPDKKAFKSRYCRAIITCSQYDQLLQYIYKGRFFYRSFGLLERVNSLFVFSYGTTDKINSLIAKEVRNFLRANKNRDCSMILQWEIFDILSKKTKFERQSTNASLVLEDHGFQIRNYKWNQCSLFRIGLKKSSKKKVSEY